MKRTVFAFILVVVLFGCKNVESTSPQSTQPAESTADIVKPNKTKQDDEIEKFFKWSKPINGLIARIEGVAISTNSNDVVFVRLKNVGETSLEVPTNNPRGSKYGIYFKVFYELTKEGKQKWLYRSEDIDDDDEDTPNQTDSTYQLLRNGESVVVVISGKLGDESKESSLMKVSLECKQNENEARWFGKIETPEFACKMPYDDYNRIYGKLDFPTYYPEFSNWRTIGGNMPVQVPEFMSVRITNWEFLWHLNLYKPETMVKEFENRFLNEKDEILRLLLASIAAKSKSLKAKEYLIESRKVSFYEIACATIGALEFAADTANPQDWVIDELISSLEDETITSNLPSIYGSQKGPSIAYLADEELKITWFLGYKKCKKAVPALIRQFRKTKGRRGYISALGLIGDKSAIPVLIEYLEKSFEWFDWTKKDDLPEHIERLITALTNLEAKEAIPLFLKGIQFPEAIEALREMRVKHAFEPIKKIVENKGIIEGVNNDKKLVKYRLDAAKIAMAALSDDPTPEFCKLLFDYELDEFKRRDVVAELAYHPDKRAIPYLVKVVKTDPSGSVVNPAIEVLAYYKYKEAVKGLIECFDANFDGKDDWKRAYTPEMFRDNIAESLRKITGQYFGTDKNIWLKWYEEKGKFDTTLK